MSDVGNGKAELSLFDRLDPGDAELRRFLQRWRMNPLTCLPFGRGSIGRLLVRIPGVGGQLASAWMRVSPWVPGHAVRLEHARRKMVDLHRNSAKRAIERRVARRREAVLDLENQLVLARLRYARAASTARRLRAMLPSELPDSGGRS